MYVYIYIYIYIVIPHCLKEHFLFEGFQVSPTYFGKCVITILGIGENILTNKRQNSQRKAYLSSALFAKNLIQIETRKNSDLRSRTLTTNGLSFGTAF